MQAFINRNTKIEQKTQVIANSRAKNPWVKGIHIEWIILFYIKAVYESSK